MVLACAAIFLLQAQDLSDRVAEQAARLKSDDPQVRTAATDELVKMGRKVIPTLEATKSDDPEVRSRVAQAIARIQKTDPFFLVRPLERRVTVSFKDLLFSEAHARVFSGFAVPPRFTHQFGFKDRISFSVEEASYWEAVEKFSAAAGAQLELPLGRAFIRERGARPTGVFGRGGRFMAEGTAYTGGTLILSLHPEPGLSPVVVAFKLARVTDDAGVSLLDRIKADLREEPPVLSVTLAKLTADPEVLRGKKVNIDGTALIELATDVEAVEFRRNEEKKLSEWPLAVDGLRLEDDSISG